MTDTIKIDTRNPITAYFNRFFSPRGDRRSLKFKKNVALSVGYKSLRVVLGLIMVPVSIDYLDTTKYGVWLTIFSVLMWSRLLNVGLGHGMRNRVAEAIALNDHKMAQIYISTSYFLFGMILAVSFILFTFLHPFINWLKILNAPEMLRKDISIMVYIVFGLICVRFLLMLIISLAQANQDPALNQLFDLLVAVFSLAGVAILNATTRSSLIYYSLAVSLSPIVVLCLFHLYLFGSKYQQYKPGIQHVNLRYAKNLTSLGINFFIIQIATVILFSSSNFLIAYFFNPEEVTRVHIANRYFNIVLMFFTLMVTPLWSAATDAYQKQDYSWIRRTVHKLLNVWFIVGILVVLMLLFSQVFYSIWLGNRVNVPFGISLVVAVFTLVRCFGSIYTNVINGLGKIYIQKINAVISVLLSIPLAIFFANTLNLGVTGILLGPLVVSLAGTTLRVIQYQKLVNHTARGLWAK